MKNENIIKDMSTGVLVVDRNSRYKLINDAARRLLPLAGKAGSLRESIETDSGNAAFYDLIIDSFIQKNCLKSSVMEYSADGKTRYYNVHARFMTEEDGVIISINDITDEVLYGRRCRDATVVSAGIISFIALWNIIVVTWQTYFPSFNAHFMTIVLLALGAIVSFSLLRLTKLDVKDMGFEIREKRRAIFINSAITALLMLLMIAAKFIFVREYDRLFDFSVFRNVSTMYYPLTVLVQEILSRGIMHTALEQVFTTKHNSVLAVFVSSLAFAGLHIHLGLNFMLGAGLLLCVFGFIYNKQRSIWALCIPHYFLCVFAEVLGFM